MSAPTVEAFAPQQEHKIGSERLTHEKIRQEFSRLAILAMLIAKYSSQESDQFFKNLQEKSETVEEPTIAEASHAEVLGLLDNALKKDRRADDIAASANIDAYRRDFYAHRVGDLPGHQEPKPFFEAAPTMADAPLGPELPNLAFNDRVRPQDARPTNEQFVAADRANEMYTRELLKQGWSGGEATAEQAKKAGRGLRRNFSPDLPTTSAADIEAVKAFNSQNAKPVTPAQPEPSNNTTPTNSSSV